MKAEKKIVLSEAEAFKKICRWCAYQERYHQETRDKLYQYGLHQAQVEQVIAKLIGEGLLNEDRFAMAYAGGKFRMLGWGREKIKLRLRQKNISEYCIKKALNQFSEEEYMQKIELVITKKLPNIKINDNLQLRYQLLQFALSKGFEKDIINDVIQSLDLQKLISR